MKKLPLYVALCLLIVSLPVVSASPDPEPAVTPCLPLGETVQCVADLAVAVITGTTAFVLCLLDAPPGSYPNGLTICFSHIIQGDFETIP